MKINNLLEWYNIINSDNEKAIKNDKDNYLDIGYIKPEYLNIKNFDLSLIDKLDKDFKLYMISLINDYNLTSTYDVVTRFHLIERALRINLDLTIQYKFNYHFDDIQKYLKKINSHYEYFTMLKYLEKIPKSEEFKFLPMPIESLHWLKNYYIQTLNIEYNDLINKILYGITINNYAKKEKKLTDNYSFRNTKKSKKMFDQFTKKLKEKYL